MEGGLTPEEEHLADAVEAALLAPRRPARVLNFVVEGCAEFEHNSVCARFVTYDSGFVTWLQGHGRGAVFDCAVCAQEVHWLRDCRVRQIETSWGTSRGCVYYVELYTAGVVDGR